MYFSIGVWVRLKYTLDKPPPLTCARFYVCLYRDKSFEEGETFFFMKFSAFKKKEIRQYE